jgi:acetyltransferase
MPLPQHYLRPLLKPTSVALVGASERAGSVGRIVLENMLAGGYQGRIYAVNPGHRTVLGQRSFASLAAIDAPVELALIATPPSMVADVLGTANAANVKVAVVMTAPPSIGSAASRAWSKDVVRAAKGSRVRVVGPGALGVIRPDIGLNATYCAPSAIRGHLALIAQSGAVATAVVDFATPLGIGFSTVISLGGGIDVAFGELLDLILADPLTHGILLHVEDVGDARSFVSALRAAARTKPVVVLKAGRSMDATTDIPPDVAFDAALRRSGTVRVSTYTQLFAAARILSRGRIPQGDRVAIVSNGRGPAVLAADAASDRGLRSASLMRETSTKIAALLGEAPARADLIDVGGRAPPALLAGAAKIALDDPNVDAIVALHVPRPIIPPLAAAEALANIAKDSLKPVLAAWMGAVDRQEVHAALEAGNVSNFFTPENAVDALSFLVAYRNNQEWLLEVPPPQPEPQPLDLAPLETLRQKLVDAKRARLTAGEIGDVLNAFGIARSAVFDRLTAAEEHTRQWRYPLLMELDATETAGVRRIVRIRRSLGKAWTELQQTGKRRSPPQWNGRFVLREGPRESSAPGLAVGVSTDRSFGPVLWMQRGSESSSLVRRRVVMLPPLNDRLAADAIVGAISDSGESPDAVVVAALVELLTKLSALVCALPWVTDVVLDPVLIDAGRAYVVGSRMNAAPTRKLLRGYPHMAIHPYPVELIGDVPLRDGTVLHVRPIRPEDADMERSFVNGLSEETRYFRFFYRISELTPSMLARFTQVDYDRELALVAITSDEGGAQAFVGVARYIANPDRTSAEFAVVVADAWQRRGVARMLMQGLIVCAKRRGLERLEGTVLRENEAMRAFVRALGFRIDDDPEDPTQVIVTLPLA